MKKFLLMLLPLAAMVTGCRFDDSDIWDELNNHETRILALEKSVNTDLASLKAIIDELKAEVYVSSVVPTDNGFTLTFTDGKTFTISNGANGNDAQTPVIGLRQYTDGLYYWTLGEDWLLDASGNMVRASGTDGADGIDGQPGQDGVTPIVKIENKKWYVSTDNGATWQEVGDATVVGDSIFKSVKKDTEDKNLILELQNGDIITIPIVADVQKLQLIFDEAAISTILAGQSATVDYQIVAPEGETVEFDTFENNGYSVVVTPSTTTENTGTITVTAPDPATKGKVLFILTGSKGSSFVKAVTINGDPSMTVEKSEYIFDAEGGSITIPVLANVEFTAEIQDAPAWIAKGAAPREFVLQENESEDSRSANIIFSAEGLNSVTVKVTQLGAETIAISVPTTNIEATDTEFDVVILTNAEVTATPDVAWIHNNGSKALTSKTFSFTVDENTGEEREGHIEFASAKKNQIVTVIQAAAKVGDEAKGTGTLEDPYNPAAAVAAVANLTWTSNTDYQSTDEVYVKGKISRIANKGTYTEGGTYGNASFYITENGTDGTEFYAFRVLYLGNKKFEAGQTDIEVGDEVVIYGKLMNYRGNTPETVSGSAYLYALNGETGEGDNPGDDDGDGPKKVTVAQFIAAEVAADQWYQLTGTITNIASTVYGNFDLTDETGTVYIYGLTPAQSESNTRTFSTLGLKVGDVVTIATLRAEFNGTPQGGGTPPAYYISHVPAATITLPATSATIHVGETFSIGASTDGGALSYKSSDESVATVDGSGVITGVAAGTASVTVTAAATSEYAKNTATVKVTVTPAGQSVVWKAVSIGDISSIESGSTVVIVSTVSGAAYAMSNGNGTSSAPSAVAVTVNAGTIDDPAANIQWVFTKDGTNYQFGVADTNNYLYCTNANNGLRVGTSTGNTFVVTSSYFVNVAQNRYVGVYNKQDWRSYTSINNNIKDQSFTLFVKTIE